MTFTASDIKGLGTILGIWAHPDDESWCSAGLMAQAVQNGQRVVCVTATKGDSGGTADEARWPQSKMGEIRAKQLKEALNILGVTEHYWLNCEDGELANIPADPNVKDLADLIGKINPDTIITFGPDGLTGHSDHSTVYRWALAAKKTANSKTKIYCVTETEENFALMPLDLQKVLYFNTEKPTMVSQDKASLLFELPPHILRLKIDAVKTVTLANADSFFLRPGGKKYVEEASSKEAFMLSSGE